MDLYNNTYLKNYLGIFQKALNISNLTIGELYKIVVQYNGIKPVEGTNNIFNRNEINGLLKNITALGNSITHLQSDRKEEKQKTVNTTNPQQTKTIEPRTQEQNFYAKNGRNPNYYSSDAMRQASNELLANDEVFFEDKNDDELYESLFSKKIYLTEEQINTIKEKLDVTNKFTYSYADNDPEKVSFKVNGEEGHLTFNDDNSRAFIVMNNINSFNSNFDVLIGENKYIWHYSLIKEFLEIEGNKLGYDYYEDFERTEHYFDLVDYLVENIVAFGRYWVFKYENQTMYFFSFWGQRAVEQKTSQQLDLSSQFLIKMVKLIQNKAGLDKNLPTYIACGKEMFFEINENGYIDTNVDKNSSVYLKKLHTLTAEEKHKATDEFRKLRDKIIGKKLSMSDTSGNFKGEMPMAQYHALTRMDENIEIGSHYNTPNFIECTIDGKYFHLSWFDDNAVGFIMLEDGTTQYSYNPIQAHPKILYNFAVRLATDNFQRILEPSLFDKKMDELQKQNKTFGRYWRNVDGYTIFSYWNEGDRTICGNIKDIILKVCQEREINPETVYIIYGDNKPVKLTDEQDLKFHVDLDKEKQAKEIHNLTPDEKWKETASFRGVRDKILGKKLTKQDGSEMPMAQYNALRYVDESKKTVNKNDKGEIVPNICPECGSKIGLYIQGEPIYRCSNEKCKKYFGTLPFPKTLNEALINGFPKDLEKTIPELESFGRKLVKKGDKIEIFYCFGKNGMGLTCELDEIGKDIQELAKDYFLYLDYEPHFDTMDDVYDLKVVGHKKNDKDKKELEKQEGYILKRIDEMKQNINSKKKVYLTEEQITYIKENTNSVDPNKVLLIDKYLNNNFVRAAIPTIGEDGYPKTLSIVGMKGTDGKVIRNMTSKQLYYLLQDKFKNIFADKDKRNRFIKQVIKDWYNKKITKDGLLSVNQY